ncbi:hypothetical protein OF83DRAFT_135211 [Amylostereum chailletii]|nr:hypothetical protein OF83DRAFT_135211 [Amylostereum chailletii]
MNSLAWLAVSHVCHLWREVSLGHRGLWTYIPVCEEVASLSYSHELLRRSHVTPLSLYWRELPKPEGEEKTIALLEAVMTQKRENIASLNLYPYRSSFLQTVAKAPFPILSSLSLTIMHDEFPVSLKNMFTVTPRLTFLRLYNCVFPWNHPVYRTLTSFTIHVTSREKYINMTVKYLNSLFAGMANLTVLDIRDDFSPVHLAGRDNPDPNPTVHLPPALKHLFVSSPDADGVFRLASRFSLNTIPKTDIVLKETAKEQARRYLMAYLKRRTESPNAPHAMRMNISSQSCEPHRMHKIILTSGRFPVDSESQRPRIVSDVASNWPSELRVEFYTHMHQLQDRPPHGVPSLRGANLAEVVVLSVHSEEEMPIAFWRLLFSACPMLEHLHVSESTLITTTLKFLTALFPETSEETKDGEKMSAPAPAPVAPSPAPTDAALTPIPVLTPVLLPRLECLFVIEPYSTLREIGVIKVAEKRITVGVEARQKHGGSTLRIVSPPHWLQ